jgi:2'-5' RNA ligase
MPHALVIVRVPEVEPYVARLRERFDPAARRGLGAHVTLLHSALSPSGIDAAMIAVITEAAAGVAPFHYAVTGLGRFPGTLYLVVEPAAPFDALHALLAPAPGNSPALREFVPHVSVVRKDRHGDALREAAAELTPVLEANAPIRCECREIVLLENSTGAWRQVAKFALGA